MRARWHHLNSSEPGSLQPHQRKEAWPSPALPAAQCWSPLWLRQSAAAGPRCLQAAASVLGTGAQDSVVVVGFFAFKQQHKFARGNLNRHCWQVQSYAFEGRKSPSPEALWKREAHLQIAWEKETDVKRDRVYSKPPLRVGPFPCN